MVAQVTAGMWHRLRRSAPVRRRAAAATQSRCRAFFGVHQPPATPALHESERARIVRDAEDACRGQLHVLGLGLTDCGEPIDWHRDPATSARLAAGIFAVHRDPAIDWKFCDEVNLHRHFYPLAQAYYLTGDRRFADAVMRQLVSWLKANPPIKDLYWPSALQSAVRLIAWLWVLYLLRGRGDREPRQEQTIIEAIHEHARFVERHWERSADSYNHLIGEAAGLVCAGVALPGLADSARWRDWGLGILARETTRQFGREGGHREQSLGYHVFVLEAYTHVVLLCRSNGVAVDERILSTLERMYEFVMSVMRPDGMLPNIGDEGLRWHQLSRADLRDARRLLSTGAVLFGRDDMKWAAGGFSAESEWLLGATGRARFEEISARPPSFASRCLPEAGLSVWRSGWQPLDSYLILDAGPQGIGPAGHGHAGALSIEAFGNGAPLLVDSGTFTYHGASPWRPYFRGTAAHNTVRVDGRDQAEINARPFIWDSLAQGRLKRWHVDERLGFVDSEHDGYQRLAQPVRHRRFLFWPAHQYWLIWDVVSGEGEHACESFLHFPPFATVVDRESLCCTVGDCGARLSVVPLRYDGLSAEIIRGESTPPQGWVSPAYGHKEAAPVLRYRHAATLPTVSVIALFPWSVAEAPHVRVSMVDMRVEGRPLGVDSGGCVQVTINDDVMDYILWSDLAGRKVAGNAVTDGAVAFLRVRTGMRPQGSCVGGSILCWEGTDVLESAR
jgi:hypothetical protein